MKALMGNQVSDWRRFVTTWLGVSLGLHVVAAIFSSGYQNSDEHFQILEFLGAWLGRSPVSDLPIEYHRMMRSWVQPLLYALPAELLQSLGITNPFDWAFSFRLISGLIGWCSVAALVLCVPRWIADRRWRKAAVLLMALTWYLPAFHARHSSENLGGALFFIALAGWTLGTDRGLWVKIFSGLLMGLAFHCRYQVGVMIAGFLAWVLFRKFKDRSAFKPILGLGAGLAVGLLAGVVADRVGYGRWTIAAWNYLQFNIVEGNLTAAGVSPWWDYFRRVWTESVPVLAFVNLLGLIALWVLKPGHVLTWSTAPLFLFHMAVGHKETRFLFPLAHAAPLALALVLERWALPRVVSFWSFRLGVLLNFPVLLVLTLTPMWVPGRFYTEVYRRAEAGLGELYFAEDHPYIQLGIPMNFYRPAALKVIPLPKTGELGGKSYLVAVPRVDWKGPADGAEKAECAAVFSAYPLEGIEFLASHGLERLRGLRNWTLYSCQGTKTGR